RVFADGKLGADARADFAVIEKRVSEAAGGEAGGSAEIFADAKRAALNAGAGIEGESGPHAPLDAGARESEIERPVGCETPANAGERQDGMFGIGVGTEADQPDEVA